jgi:hypothetical protein
MAALPPLQQSPALSSSRDALTGWPLMVAFQAVISLVLFHDYIFGDKFFAFVDIGSDTYAQFVPTLIHLANPANWSSAWSFNVGLGGLAPASLNPFTLLGIAAGPEHVLPMRIWVYVAKIVAGGLAFYAFVLAIGGRREVALLTGLAYSFCGYMTADGQWDPSSTELVVYAVILLAMARHCVQPNAWMIPLSIAFAAYSGTFMFSVGVFVAYAFIASCVASERPVVTARFWIKSIFPGCLLGLMLAAPVLLPSVLHLLDSPRISGPQAGFSDRIGELLSANTPHMVMVELASFFHKNILGVGNGHAGWMNYLESPGFYVGVLPLLLIPQLWYGSKMDRRILLAGAIALLLFIALPGIRYLAFGLGLPYFRVNNLWVSALLLVLFARALEGVASRGINRRLLIGTGLTLAAGLFFLEGAMRPFLSIPHVAKILALIVVAILLGLALNRLFSWQRFAYMALGLTAIEAALISYPSFHAERKVVTSAMVGYNDQTLGALAFLKARDPSFYRVEKTYNSVSFCDALAQDYMGVKSYWFQSAGIVGFYSDLDLIPRRSPLKNFTNWLPNFGDRFVLDTLVGVKYILSKTSIEWPGFRKIHAIGPLSIYENDMALPLGVVYERQFPQDQVKTLPFEVKDMVMLNAAIVDGLRGPAPRIYDAAPLAVDSPDWLDEHYEKPARHLQKRGMRISSFSDGSISGAISSDVPGVLVFSIPFARGWTVSVDSVQRPVFMANLGMLATDVPAGELKVELRYALPGLIPGLLLALAGALVVLALGFRDRRVAAPRAQ